MNYYKKLKGLEIRIDYRTTLLGIIEILSNYANKYPNLLYEYGNKDYIEEIKSQFNHFKNHEIINRFNQLIEIYDFSFSRPIQLFLELNEDLTFCIDEEHPFCLKYNNDTQIIDFLKLIKSFAEQINFEKFYRKQNNRFSQYIKNILVQLDDTRIKEFLEEYYGIVLNKKLIVNLIPWRTYGCYGTRTKECIYAHLCCHHLSKSDYDVYPISSEIFNYESFLVHEFSHSIINPIVDKSFDKFSEKEPIFKDTTKLCKVGYGSNNSILKDYLVRSVTERYLKLTNNEYYPKQCKEDELFGFIEMNDFLNLLEEYEKMKTRYINFDYYYQNVIIDFLNTKQKVKQL